MRLENAPLLHGRAGGAEAGFSYLALMIIVAVLALATSATVVLGGIAQRRDVEQRLLDVGGAYRRAIESYVEASPAGERRYPASLNDLLRDPRDPGVRRHLRRLYPDPITGRAEWGLVMAPGGGLIGVHSLSDAQPIKIADFDLGDESFEGATRYSAWVFSVRPDGASGGGQAGAAGTTSSSPLPAGGAAQVSVPLPSLFAPPTR